MKNIKVKELLELFASAMISRKNIFFRNEVADVVPLAEQTKWVTKYENNLQASKNGFKLSAIPGSLKEVPRYRFFLLYDEPPVNETLRVNTELDYYSEGFNTYKKLKERIEDGNFNAGHFSVFLRDYEGYKNVSFKAEYDEEWDRWTDFSIPCLGEIFDVETIYNGDESTKTTDAYYAGIFSSPSDLENFIQETRIFDKMMKHKAFETNGKFKYEERNFTFKIEYDDIVASFSSVERDENGNHILLQYCKDEKEAARLREM